MLSNLSHPNYSSTSFYSSAAACVAQRTGARSYSSFNLSPGSETADRNGVSQSTQHMLAIDLSMVFPWALTNYQSNIITFTNLNKGFSSGADQFGEITGF